MTHRPPQADLWRYDLGDGWEVLAGRTAVDNDILTFRIARPNDWWFHVKGVPGSHVVLQSQDDAEPSKAQLEAAAAVAAWHSKARNGGIVAVGGTLAKHVSKSRGGRAGQVMSRKERTFKVQPGLP